MDSQEIAEVFDAITTKGQNLFHDICHQGCVSLLLRAGYWIDEKNAFLLTEYDYSGEQCIHIAARRHRGGFAVQLIEILLQLGSDLNAPDRCSGNTVLHDAVLCKDYQLATWLCEQLQVNLYACNYARLTAFQIARKNKDEKMMDIFGKHGVDCEYLDLSDSDSYSDSDSDSES